MKVKLSYECTGEDEVMERVLRRGVGSAMSAE